MIGVSLFFAEWVDSYGYHSGFFENKQEYHKATFAPNCKVLHLRKWSGPKGKKTWKTIGGKGMGTYQKNKERARKLALEWQGNQDSYSREDVFSAQLLFTKLAVRYGLLTEFKDNGII